MPAAPMPASPQSNPPAGTSRICDDGVRSRLLGQPGVTGVGRAEVLSDLDLGRLGRVTRVGRAVGPDATWVTGSVLASRASGERSVLAAWPADWATGRAPRRASQPTGREWQDAMHRVRAGTRAA